MHPSLPKRLRIVAFPRHDSVFAERARELFASLPERDPSRLESALRRTYRRVRVVPRDSLASLGDEDVWYVYRDGSALAAELTNDFYRRLVDNLYDGVYFVTPSRQITYWNDAAARLTGWSAEDVVGRRCQSNLLRHCDKDGIELCRNGCPLLESMTDGEHRESILYLRHHDGHRVPVRVRTGAVRDERGRIVGGVEVFDDATAFIAAARRAKDPQRIAQTDEVTGVASREALQTELERRLVPDTPATLGILLVDLDRLQRINARHGRDAGQAALVTVARTVANAVRDVDLVGRWDGDVLAVLVPEVGPEELAVIGERVRALVARSSPRLDDGAELRVTVSIGAVVARHGESAEALMARGNRVLADGRRAGSGRLSVA